MNPGALPQADDELCAFGADHTRSIARTLEERAEIVSSVWIFRGQRFDIADFHVNAFYARPFRARAEKPTPPPDDTRSVKCVSWNQKLDALSSAQVRSDYNVLGCAVLVQH